VGGSSSNGFAPVSLGVLLWELLVSIGFYFGSYFGFSTGYPMFCVLVALCVFFLYTTLIITKKKVYFPRC
jgi:hypothetical protein